VVIRGRSKPGLLSRKILLGTTVGAAVFFIFLGVIIWGGFNTAMEATSSQEFCISCHEMEQNVYRDYTRTVHFNNSTGVRATCADCHVPRPWLHKVVRKIHSTNELFHKLLGTVDTPEKFDARRLQMARKVWDTMKASDSRECRNCHDFKTMDPAKQKPVARKQHMRAMQAGNTCIDCHMGIAHKIVHDQLDDKERAALVAPNPALAISLPPQWQAFAEKEAAEKAASAKGVVPAINTMTNMTDASRARLLDWSNVPARKVDLFYPGQGSIEWVLGDNDHDGAYPFKAGIRCIECHEEIIGDMGDKIVTGEKLEPNVIPNKRGSFPVSVQAAHDEENLYLRFSWPQGEHAPAPFAEGGKMDPENPMKLAVMMANDEVEFADRAGCWSACHADAQTMPFAPANQKVTKYLIESRTGLEAKDQNDKPMKRKSQDAIQAELDAGHFMDLIFYKSGTGEVEDGYILDERVMQGGQGAEFYAHQENEQWVVEMKRRLKSDKIGDISMKLDRLYNLSFAIHDDYSNARYHHVSLGYKLGFDNTSAEINAIKK
jgi:nitrate/TMAO reductase-like tetraheme cytochrome c subunit